MKATLTLLFTSFTLCVLSQSPLLDSPHFNLNNQKDVQEIARTSNDMGEVCLSINPDSESKIYLKLNNYLQIAGSFNRRDLCYQLMEKYDLSQTVLYSALNYATLVADTGQIIKSYLYLSCLMEYESKYEASLDYMYKALEYIEFINDANQRITAYLNIANLHTTRGDDDKALVKFYIAAALCETTKGKGTQLNYCYQRIAAIYNRMDNPQKAIEFAIKALENIDFTQIRANRVETYGTLSLSYYMLNDFENAVTYGIMALKLAQKLELPKLVADCLHDLGTIYLKKGDPEKAIYYYLSAQPHFENLENKFPLAMNLENLANSYARSGDYKKAWEFQKRHDMLKDSLYSGRNEKVLQELETEYIAKLSEAELRIQTISGEIKDERIARQKILNIAIGAITILLLLIFIMVWVNTNNESKCAE